jgi:hypothetical protein
MDNGTSIAVFEDPFIRKLVGDLLTRRGYRVVGSDVGHAAEVLGSGADKVRLVITNHPEDFVQFADRLPVLYIAATPDEELAMCFRAHRTLRKPFINDQLLAAVRSLVG